MDSECEATNPIENQELSARQALIARYQFLDGFNSVRNKRPRAKRQRVELSDERCIELARMPSLGLAEWVALTGVGLGEHNRFSIGFDGVGFTKSEQDDIGEESLEWQEYMLRDNEHEALAFPCTPTRLLEFIASELCRELAGFSVPCAFQEAVAQNVNATGAETPSIDSAEICLKEPDEGTPSNSVIFIINGREAVPIRAIPLATGWEVSPDILSASLAHTAKGIRLENLFAYQPRTDGTFAPVLPKEWDGVDDRLRALSASLQAKNSDRTITRPEWLRESIPLLPAGVFVWKDDFEKAFWRQFSPNSPVGVTYLEGTRPGDGELNFSPMIPAELRQQVSEGFALGEIAQAPADSLKEPLSNLPSQQRVVAEEHLRNRPTPKSVNVQTNVTPAVVECVFNANTTNKDIPKESPPAEGVKRKRSALIAEVSKFWPSVKTDLNDSGRRGLNKVAKHKDHGFWKVEPALNWAAERGKIIKERAVAFVKQNDESEFSLMLRNLFKLD